MYLVLVDTPRLVVLIAEGLAGPQAPDKALVHGEHFAKTVQQSVSGMVRGGSFASQGLAQFRPNKRHPQRIAPYDKYMGLRQGRAEVPSASSAHVRCCRQASYQGECTPRPFRLLPFSPICEFLLISHLQMQRKNQLDRQTSPCCARA